MVPERRDGPLIYRNNNIAMVPTGTRSFQKQDTDQYQEDRRQQDERILKQETQRVALKVKPFHDATSMTKLYAHRERVSTRELPSRGDSELANRAISPGSWKEERLKP
jgi:hypothetical protein